jgi:hypothetical protein
MNQRKATDIIKLIASNGRNPAARKLRNIDEKDINELASKVSMLHDEKLFIQMLATLIIDKTKNQ